MDDATQLPFTTPICPRPVPVWDVCGQEAISTDTVCEDNGNLKYSDISNLLCNCLITQGALDTLASCALEVDMETDCLQQIRVRNI
jgi:hypothetical protein